MLKKTFDYNTMTSNVNIKLENNKPLNIDLTNPYSADYSEYRKKQTYIVRDILAVMSIINTVLNRAGFLPETDISDIYEVNYTLKFNNNDDKVRIAVEPILYELEAANSDCESYYDDNLIYPDMRSDNNDVVTYPDPSNEDTYNLILIKTDVSNIGFDILEKVGKYIFELFNYNIDTNTLDGLWNNTDADYLNHVSKYVNRSFVFRERYRNDYGDNKLTIDCKYYHTEMDKFLENIARITSYIYETIDTINKCFNEVKEIEEVHNEIVITQFKDETLVLLEISSNKHEDIRYHTNPIVIPKYVMDSDNYGKSVTAIILSDLINVIRYYNYHFNEELLDNLSNALEHLETDD